MFKTCAYQLHLCIRVSSGPHQKVRWTEYTYAAPEDGEWWFWWSSLERIEPITETRRAADKIAFVVGLSRVS